MLAEAQVGGVEGEGPKGTAIHHLWTNVGVSSIPFNNMTHR